MLLNRMTEEEAESIKIEEERLLQLAEHSKTEALEHYKKEKKVAKGKEKDIPKDVLLTPQVLEYNSFVENKNATAESISRILSFRSKWNDVGYGLVVDGAVSKYFDQAVVLQGIHISFPSAVFVNLAVEKGEDGYTGWLSHLQDIKLAEKERLQRAIESTKKSILKNFKPQKGFCFSKCMITIRSLNFLCFYLGKPTGYADLEASLNTSEVAECLPSGEEHWINIETGLLVELDSQEVKALDDKDRNNYLKQVRTPLPLLRSKT